MAATAPLCTFARARKTCPYQLTVGGCRFRLPVTQRPEAEVEVAKRKEEEEVDLVRAAKRQKRYGREGASFVERVNSGELKGDHTTRVFTDFERGLEMDCS